MNTTLQNDIDLKKEEKQDGSSVGDFFSSEEMLKAGIHIGHKKSRFHPSMGKYILFVRNNIRIIDIEKTAKQLKSAAEFLKDIINKEGDILFVGTSVPANRILKEAALNLKMPYVTNRWLGGTLTNFSTIRKRLEYFLDLEEKKERGELNKYTKKEQAMFEKEIRDLQKKFGGIKNMKKLPKAIFTVNVLAHKDVLREAKKMKIPVVAVCDTDSDPKLASFTIPSNDSSVAAVEYIVKSLFGDVLKKEDKEKEEKISE